LRDYFSAIVTHYLPPYLSRGDCFKLNFGVQLFFNECVSMEPSLKILFGSVVDVVHILVIYVHNLSALVTEC